MAQQTTTPNKPRALADLHLNDLLTHDQATSSEDEGAAGSRNLDGDPTSAIQVSIGERQTRLTSPLTPAAEKTAALDAAGGFFLPGLEGIAELDGTESSEDVSTARQEAEEGSNGLATAAQSKSNAVDTPGRDTVTERTERKTQGRLPSPWRPPPKRKSLLKDGMSFYKRGTGASESTMDHWHRALMSSLPSMPKHFALSSPFTTSNDTQPSQSSAGKQASPQHSDSALGNAQSKRLVRQRSESESHARDLVRTISPREQEEAEATISDLPTRPQLHATKSRGSQLRRSTSDNSLVTHRTLSRVSSLGDDTRFEHVQEQVNSRLKAIKDSWQDSNYSNIRLPSLASLTPDFLRERSASLGKKDAVDTSVASHDLKPEDPMTRQPWHSIKGAAADSTKPSTHPHFHKALAELEGDVVVLGGYRGSILRSAEPPHRQLWVPVKKVDLEVGISEQDDYRASDKVIPGGMLTHIGPVDIARRLFKRLRACENAREERLRVHDYGYDWRLHPLFLSQQLVSFLEKLECNQPGVRKAERGATVIAHSLGGLITRHAVNQRPELFRGVVYAGVPHTCVNILGPMRNGDEVLLSSRVLTAQVNFTIRTSFALLPLDGRCFFDKVTKEEYPVDFFDPQHWVDYRWSPCVGRPLPPLNLAADKPTGLAGYMSTVTNALPSLPGIPGRKSSISHPKPSSTESSLPAEPNSMSSGGSAETTTNNNIDRTNSPPETDTSPSPRTAVTIPREKAIEYLTRTLPTVKKFKIQLAHLPSHTAQNRYPPISVIYGKSTPTVYGAKVLGREGIKNADAYDELAFASGDGVVLARAAMVPEGYKVEKGGSVSSERGHVTLLGDLEAVGRCLIAVGEGRRGRGVGLGVQGGGCR
ncbi:hypothetical protein LTR62_001046 [Meristemomyces frigidus]|uniref:Uncharacterized protein n=1 Tax=Meristemomyces frigidus TaxID=1508187 RepID=A0AAN7YMJ9_9PEZI|nr:hypothetical protein LTR62_001046 [Meristemomyces frigidus]